MRVILTILAIVILQPIYCETQIHSSNDKYLTYYHIEFKLTQDNFILPKNSARDDGQFEILIPKNQFPIGAPNCKQNIILRMPGTFASKNGKAYQQRERLFNLIKKLKLGYIKSLSVFIELNPYIKVLNKDPLDIQLQYCNVFFRTANGLYVDHL